MGSSLLTKAVFEIKFTALQIKPEWRNWQTRYVQGVVRVPSCGFKSHLRHKQRLAGRRVFCLPPPCLPSQDSLTSFSFRSKMRTAKCLYNVEKVRFIRIPGIETPSWRTPSGARPLRGEAGGAVV